MTEKAAVTTIDTSMMDGAALAFIGDAVYEIYVRKHVLAEAGSGHQSMALKVDALHHGTVQFVNAEAQAFAIKAMADDLPEEEQAVVRRARNHKPHSVPKHADVMDYKWATAFEALVGYLYLTGETEEMEKVIRRAITVIEDQR